MQHLQLCDGKLFDRIGDQVLPPKGIRKSKRIRCPMHVGCELHYSSPHLALTRVNAGFPLSSSQERDDSAATGFTGAANITGRTGANQNHHKPISRLSRKAAGA